MKYEISSCIKHIMKKTCVISSTKSSNRPLWASLLKIVLYFSYEKLELQSYLYSIRMHYFLHHLYSFKHLMVDILILHIQLLNSFLNVLFRLIARSSNIRVLYVPIHLVTFAFIFFIDLLNNFEVLSSLICWSSLFNRYKTFTLELVWMVWTIAIVLMKHNADISVISSCSPQ